MNAAGYLCLNGIEIANELRTASYLRRGSYTGWRVNLRAPRLPEGTGYVDVYSDIYLADPMDERNLACYCAALADDGPYVTPIADPAPWFLASRPESGEFLGFYPTSIRPLSVIGRQVSPRGGAGGTISAARPKHRVVSVAGVLIASSARGMWWGERWLTELLADRSCGCGAAELGFLPACPDDDGTDADLAFRTLTRVGVVDGPVFGSVNGLPDCIVQDVAFQFAAGDPWIRSPESTVMDAQAIVAGATICADVTQDEYIGDTAVRISLNAAGPDPVENITLRATVDGHSTPCAEYVVASLPASTTLVIDSAARTVQVVQNSTGEVVGGLDALTLTGLFKWIEVQPCTTVSICVDATDAAVEVNASTTVTIDAIPREL